MKKFKSAILALLCLVLGLCSLLGCNKNEAYKLSHYSYATGDGTMFNKDLFYANMLEATMGDPTMLVVEEEDGPTFYAVGTQTGVDFRMWKSKDLTDWEMIGVCYTPDANSFAYKDHWAPQLLWDASADWSYYLGDNAGEGQGLYCLFFSARTSVDGPCQLQCAFSKNVEGPYTVPYTTNANGDWYDSSSYLYDIEKIKDLGLWEDSRYGALYKSTRGFIDAFPFVDPVSGDKYLYFVKSRSGGDLSNDIWGVKMKDWISPDYETTTPLSSHGWVDVEKREEYNWQRIAGAYIDEGPVMIYRDFTNDNVDNGTYFLMISLGGTGDKFYAPVQALCDSPLGMFKKVQPEDGGFICLPGIDWDVVASGHHDIVPIGNELYNVYHTYEVLGSSTVGKRYIACDKVEFIQNSKGQTIMHTNGPSKAMQPLPELVSGYTNVAKQATVTATNSDGADVKLLNDGLIALGEENWQVGEYQTTKSETTITLKFDKWVNACAIMIYNSYDWKKIFTEVSRIEFTTKKGTAYIDNLGFNLEINRVPYSYFFEDLEAAEDDIASGDYDIIRPLGAAVAEFDEMQINKVKITVKKASEKTAIGISDIVILGKAA